MVVAVIVGVIVGVIDVDYGREGVDKQAIMREVAIGLHIVSIDIVLAIIIVVVVVVVVIVLIDSVC